MYYIIAFFTFILSLKTSWIYNNFTYLSYQPTLRIYCETKTTCYARGNNKALASG